MKENFKNAFNLLLPGGHSFIATLYIQGCIYRGSRGSLGYPGFGGIIKAEAIKREIFEDFYL